MSALDDARAELATTRVDEIRDNVAALLLRARLAGLVAECEREAACFDLVRVVVGSIDAGALNDLEAGWARIRAGKSTLFDELAL